MVCLSGGEGAWSNIQTCSHTRYNSLNLQQLLKVKTKTKLNFVPSEQAKNILGECKNTSFLFAERKIMQKPQSSRHKVQCCLWLPARFTWNGILDFDWAICSTFWMLLGLCRRLTYNQTPLERSANSNQEKTSFKTENWGKLPIERLIWYDDIYILSYNIGSYLKTCGHYHPGVIYECKIPVFVAMDVHVLLSLSFNMWNFIMECAYILPQPNP